MKNYVYPRTLKRLSIIIILLFTFSCTKDLETLTQSPSSPTENPIAQFYNQTTPIDITILLSLKQDTLFNEYVRFLDYSYILHLTDSLRKTTNNKEEFYTQYQDIMQKRSGTLKERFIKSKEDYPKDFLRYVIHESRLKRNNNKTKNVDIDDIIVDGSDEVYAKMANCYNNIYGALISLANQSYVQYFSKIEACAYNGCLSHEKLITATIYGVFGQGGSCVSLYVTQWLSDNFRRHITGSDVRMGVENGYIERMTVNELRQESDVCVGMITGVLAWNPNFELGFVTMMSCYENHESGSSGGGAGSGGGTTNPPTNPNTETEAEKSIKQNAPKASKIINLKSELTIEQWKEIEEIFENMVGMNKIVTAILELGGDNIINLTFNPNTESGMKGWDINLSEISYSYVSEEFFHAYQRAVNGPPTNANALSREFEAKFYSYFNGNLSGNNIFLFMHNDTYNIISPWLSDNYDNMMSMEPTTRMDRETYISMMQSYKAHQSPPYDTMNFDPDYGFSLALNLFVQ